MTWFRNGVKSVGGRSMVAMECHGILALRHSPWLFSESFIGFTSRGRREILKQTRIISNRILVSPHCLGCPDFVTSPRNPYFNSSYLQIGAKYGKIFSVTPSEGFVRWGAWSGMQFGGLGGVPSVWTLVRWLWTHKVHVLSTSKVNGTACWNMYDLCATLDGQNPTLDGMVIPVQPFNYLGYLWYLHILQYHLMQTCWPIHHMERCSHRFAGWWGPQEDINLTVAFHPTHGPWAALSGRFLVASLASRNGWINWDTLKCFTSNKTYCI